MHALVRCSSRSKSVQNLYHAWTDGSGKWGAVEDPNQCRVYILLGPISPKLKKLRKNEPNLPHFHALMRILNSTCPLPAVIWSLATPSFTPRRPETQNWELWSQSVQDLYHAWTRQQCMHKSGAIQDPNQCRIYIMLGLIALASEVLFKFQINAGFISC